MPARPRFALNSRSTITNRGPRSCPLRRRRKSSPNWPRRVLRAAINMGNFLLVTGKDAVGRPVGRVARHGGGARGAARRAGQVRALRAARRHRRRRREGHVGHRQYRRRAAARRGHQFHRRLLRDRGDLSGAGRLADPQRRRGRSARQPRRGDGAQRLRAVARKQLQARANCCSSTPPTRRSRPLSTRRWTPMPGCGRG